MNCHVEGCPHIALRGSFLCRNHWKRVPSAIKKAVKRHNRLASVALDNKSLPAPEIERTRNTLWVVKEAAIQAAGLEADE